MAEPRKIRSYGIHISEERWADCPAVIARIMAREGDSPSPINPRSEGEDSIWDAPKRTDGLALDGLEIRVHVGDVGRKPYIAGPSIDFRAVHYIDKRLARRMVRTLDKIERQLDKTKAREAGDVLMAVAKAIGATWTVNRVGDQRPGSFYQDDQWRFGDLTEGRDQFRRSIEKIRPPAESEAA